MTRDGKTAEVIIRMGGKGDGIGAVQGMGDRQQSVLSVVGIGVLLHVR